MTDGSSATSPHCVAQDRHAVRSESLLDSEPLDQVAEALEHRAVAEPVGVFDEKLIVAVLARHVLAKNIRDRSDAAAQAGIVEDVDDRPRRVGDRHAGLPAPHSNRAEECLPGPHGEVERDALHLDLSLAHLLRRHHEHRSEDLLGQVPVLARAPPTDVAGAEHLIGHDPGVLDPFAGLPRI